MAEVCVIGAGPAGSTFAARLAQLGHAVHLVERERFPRRHLGESLSPGVMRLLDAAGMREAVEAAGFSRVKEVWVKWADGLQLREDPHEQGLLVDRGEFDLRLLERARAFGVRVWQPARVAQQVWDGAKWRVRIEAEADARSLSVDFIADAGGRRQTRHRTKAGATTLAVYAYWRGARLPTVPRIEAGPDAWYWGVPLPDGAYNTLIFLDPAAFRSAPGDTLSERFTGLIGRTDLMKECGSVELVAPVRAIDATAYLSTDCVAPTRIQIGDAAVAIDPISSSGVQKAIQTALSAAIVVNTLLRQPESADVALSFYRTQLAEASERHRRWAANHYRDVADRCDRPFWRERGVSLAAPDPPPLPVIDAHALMTAPVELSPELRFIATPCLRGDFVSTASALHHPRLASPVGFLSGCELAPLLRGLTPGKTPLQIAQSWSKCMPLASGLAIAGWLVNHGILVERSAGGMAS